MRACVAAIFLMCVFDCACPRDADALSCATRGWWNFDRIDGDPQKRRQDAEARAALDNLGGIVFRGRFASARSLSDPRKSNSPVLMIVFKDVTILRGEMPRSAHDRKAFLLYYAWCDANCGPAGHGWPRGLKTYGAFRFDGEPIRDTGTIGQKVVYQGRVDAWSGACNPIQLTPLQEQLLNAPTDEIARLMREYPYHPIGQYEPAGPD